ncbi:MAG: hypothetical protein H7039_21140 [Bryobacteraceae bacterium]|nr:hypothetical protein [Bryobacteraceae bacterium]
MRVIPVLLFAAGCPMLLAADAIAPEVQILQRARTHMSDTLEHLPNYTCLQTIERTQRLAPRRKPSVLDVVRIEVALVDGKELFSWPGSGKFVDTEISEMIPGGATGTGSFGLHAKSVFQSSVATFRYEGQEIRAGRNSHKWTFAVPQFRSGFSLRAGTREAVVGYSGAFWIDEQTLDAVRLEVHADDIPPILRISSASDTVEYRRAQIGAQEFLLPSTAELRMADNNGNENLNRTVFSSCRQYTGESTLLADEPEAKPIVQEAERILEAPAGLTLHFSLDTPIILKSAAVGDPVTAVLLKSVKLPDGSAIPKGAFVHGRLTHLRASSAMRVPSLAIGLKFFEMEAPGLRVRMNGVLHLLHTASPEFINRPSAPGQLSAARLENETILGSLIFVRDYTSQLRRGLSFIWQTTPLRSGDRP